MKTQFEKIYVLSLITNHSRQEFIKHQMDDLGLEFEFIYGTAFYELTNDSDNHIINWPNVWPWKNLQASGRSFGCTISHYNAVSQAYYLGYNNVLILEDDICFLKDKNIVEYYLNNVPNDCDFITYDLRFIDNNDLHNFCDNNDYHINKYLHIKNNIVTLCGGMCYGLMNRDIMKLYLDNQNKQLFISDRVKDIFWTDDNSKIKRYCATQCIGLGQYLIEKMIEHRYYDWAISYESAYQYVWNLCGNDFYIPEQYLSWTQY